MRLTSPDPKRPSLTTVELIAMVGGLMALNALSIDIILPAMGEAGAALGAPGNERQLIITSYMLGFGAAQLVFGPLADSLGRRRVLLGALIAYLAGNSVFSSYLQIHHVPGAGELAVFLGALVGGGLGFLWFNAPPAKIFMGDTGSLSLGAALGVTSIITKHELVLAIVGGLFVLETVSVIVQVVSFKLTGKRVFAMAPLHHHFEKKGWAESTIVIRFWIIASILALIGLSTLKLR